MNHIQVSGVGKAYKHYASRWGRLWEWLSFHKARFHEPVWVLRGVSFDVRAGEAVGIVGQNGAGKSTLLKLITGTTQPTTGSVTVNGRVAALLELGMGFHPDFSGRQNVYMAGQLLGHTAADISAKFESIEDFAEIGAYIDEPLRTYSSGMQVRLAFAVATAIRPEVLIVDEALAVGDTYFQHKCFARIRAFKQEGTTLLFVSHDPAAVKTLCDRAVLLEEGLLIKDGPPDAVLDYYNASIARREADYAIQESELRVDRTRSTRSGSREASIEAIEALDAGQVTRAFRIGQAMTFRVRFSARVPLAGLTVGILIRDRLGNDVFGTNTHHLGIAPPSIAPGSVYVCDFNVRALAIGVGNYNVSVALHSDATHLENNYDWWDRALVFQVIQGDGPVSIGLCSLSVEGLFAGDQRQDGTSTVGNAYPAQLIENQVGARK